MDPKQCPSLQELSKVQISGSWCRLSISCYCSNLGSPPPAPRLSPETGPPCWLLGGWRTCRCVFFGLSLRSSGFSCDLVSPCKARERGPDPPAVAGSAWSAGASGSGLRLETFRLYWELRSSVLLARRADRGWRSRCCTSFLQTALWTHTQLSAFPMRERENSRG